MERIRQSATATLDEDYPFWGTAEKMPPRYRHLRSSEQMADRDHDCNSCGNPIKPGDTYGKDVYIRWKNLYEYKYHVMPECPHPEDDPWDDEDFWDQERETHEAMENMDMPTEKIAA